MFRRRAAAATAWGQICRRTFGISWAQLPDVTTGLNSSDFNMQDSPASALFPFWLALARLRFTWQVILLNSAVFLPKLRFIWQIALRNRHFWHIRPYLIGRKLILPLTYRTRNAQDDFHVSTACLWSWLNVRPECDLLWCATKVAKEKHYCITWCCLEKPHLRLRQACTSTPPRPAYLIHYLSGLFRRHILPLIA